MFSADQQDQIRQLLSFVLQGIVAQQLVPKTYEPGRLLALEILIPNPAVRNLIRENKMHQVYSQMQIGQDKTGMITMNQSLKESVDKGFIDVNTAMAYSPVPEEMMKMLGLKEKAKAS
jgi:twitching motility protein PilT